MQLLLYNRGQLGFGEPARPLVERLEGREELDVVKAGHVGPIVGAANLRHYRNHFGMAAQDGAHPVGILGGLFARNGHWQRGTNPEISLFKFGHKLAPKQREQGHAQKNGNRAQRQRALGPAQSRIEEWIVDAVEEAHQSVLLLLVRDV